MVWHGIDIYGILADYTGKTTKQVKEMDITYEQLIGALNKASQENGKYYNGQSAMADTLSGKISMLKKTFEDLTGQLSQSLMPIIEKITEKLQGFADWVGNLSDEQKELITKVGLFVVALGPALIIIGKVVAVLGIIISKIGSLLMFLGKAKAVIVTLATTLGLPLAPILLVVGAIAGVIAILVTLYNKCDWFREGVNNTIEAIKEFTLGLIDFLKTFFTETIPSWFQSAREWIANAPTNIGIAIGHILANIVNFGYNVWVWIQTKLPEIIDGIVNWFATLPSRIWEWLTQVISDFVQWCNDMLAKVQEIVPTIIDGITGFFEELPRKIKRYRT